MLVSRLYWAQKSGTPAALARTLCQLNTEKILQSNSNDTFPTSLHFISAPAQVSQLPNNFIQFAHGHLTTQSA